MVQLSKKPLDKDIEKELFGQFWRSFEKIADSYDSSQFFSDLLTNTEQLMLAKRFATALLLIRGKKPVEIREVLHVSFTTIGTVDGWLKNAKPKTREIFNWISKQKDWEAFWDKVEEILDKLPPKYHSDWSAAGKEKYKRIGKRSARRILR